MEKLLKGNVKVSGGKVLSTFQENFKESDMLFGKATYLWP